MTDDPLDHRIRTGIDALVRSAPEPPPFDELASAAPAPSAQRGRSMLLAAAAVAVVLAIGALVAVLARPDDARPAVRTGTTTTAPGTEAPLFDTRWRLWSASVDGDPVAFDPESPPELRLTHTSGCEGHTEPCTPPPGDTASWYDGCNQGAASVRIDGDEGEVQAGTGASTEMACAPAKPSLSDPHISTPFRAVLDGPFTITRQDGDLVLTADGTRLRFQPDDEGFAPTSADVLVEDEAGGVAYRVTWARDDERYSLDLQLDDRGVGRSGSGLSAEVDDQSSNAMQTGVGDANLLFGLVQSDAERVVYQPEGGDPVELPRYELDGADPGYQAVLGPVEQAITWDLVAYDARGNEVDRLHWGS